jgi:hypothetical protein
VEKKMPQYLSSPYQLLWFEPDDLSIIVVGYLLAMVFGGVFWLGMIVGPVTYGLLKRRYPRGFLRHMFYMIGWTKLHGYPTFFEEEFVE